MRMSFRSIALLTGLKLEITGLENLPEADAHCIFVANHSSYLDVFVLITGIPRSLSFVAKVELAGSFFSRKLLDRIDVEYVDRFDRTKGVEAAEP